MSRRPLLLVVDDNEMNRDALSRRLEMKGYGVAVAAGGDEALSRVATEPFDLLLLDVEMPGIGGLDVLTRIRERYSPTEMPVIMVTARTDGADVVEAFRLGANDYVTKPIDFPIALARIGTHLAHKRALEDLHESEQRYALAMQGANDGLWDWNLATNDVHWSERWKAMLGCEDAPVSASPDEWFSRVHRDDVGRVRKELEAHLTCGEGNWESEHRILHRNGTFRWVLCRAAAIRNSEGTATRLAGSLTDITDAKVSDALTGLPNRLLFVDLIDRAIKRTERRKNYTFALLALSLDRFRIVGDSLGPLTADRFLVAVAQRLQASLRPTDAVTAEEGNVTLARITGEEFTVLVDDIAEVNDAVRVAERLRRALEKPFAIDGHELFTSATVGIAVSTTGYHKPEEILRDASAALHRAQAKGAPSELFDMAMRDRAVARLRLETDLRNGIRDNHFVVHYQPIVSLDSGRMAGFEALVRWRHPARGLLAPLEFIHVAEDTGMIVPIGRMILREACRQMASWERRFGGGTSAVICVNVSSRQFVESDLAADVELILRETGLPASNLKLEITESAFIGNVADAQVTLSRLQSIGVAWSIDDFGTGYSSLSHLHQLQVDTVKIDRSFVSRMSVDKDGWEMVRAIVTLAHNLSMDVVAEGVENIAQVASLRALGCEYAQGFYLSKPVDALAADRLNASQPWRFAPVFKPAVTAPDLHHAV
ncbi:MAG TPA: EAL domain-containing protein [Vicinamibacterales bacterium]|nr:EAL domain-containing protein [Vicinamibacterales bacterium]